MDKIQRTIAEQPGTSLVRFPCVALLGSAALGAQPILASGCAQKQWRCQPPGVSCCHSFILRLSLSALAHSSLNSTASPSTCKTAT